MSGDHLRDTDPAPCQFRIAQERIAELEAGLDEAMGWNWIDDDMNDEVANRLAALLEGE